MSRRLRGIVALAGFAVALGVAAPAAHADSIGQVSALDSQIASVKAQLHDSQAQLASVSAELTQASNQVERLQIQLDAARAKLVDRGPRSGRVVAAATTLVHRVRLRLKTARARLSTDLAHARTTDTIGQVAALEDQLDGLTAERTALVAADPLLQAGSTADAAPEPGSSIERGAWALALLDALQAPVCQSNLTSLVAWQTAEDTTAGWNPLATTLPAPGDTQFNSAGVRNYPSLADGIQATVDTLNEGYYTQGYGWIEYRLRTCADPIVTVKAINASNWCRGCAGGRYVTGVLGTVEENYPVFAGM